MLVKACSRNKHADTPSVSLLSLITLSPLFSSYSCPLRLSSLSFLLCSLLPFARSFPSSSHNTQAKDEDVTATAHTIGGVEEEADDGTGLALLSAPCCISCCACCSGSKYSTTRSMLPPWAINISFIVAGSNVGNMRQSEVTGSSPGGEMAEGPKTGEPLPSEILRWFARCLLLLAGVMERGCWSGEASGGDRRLPELLLLLVAFIVGVV